MNVAVIHYHFNRGGVTQVVGNHLRALNEVHRGEDRGRVALIFGGRRDGIADDFAAEFDKLDVSMHVVPELEYDEGPTADHQLLAERLKSALLKLDFAPHETLLHVHNHSLGKNLSLPGALRELAGGGYRLLLHIHDFAEDFRPDNYRRMSDAFGDQLPATVYPQAGNVHYAVLNGRDLQILRRANVDEARLHLLPNPVSGFGPMPPKDEARAKLAETLGVPTDGRYILYPVRGIRRKNLGEAVLWSVLAGDDVTVGFTLPPQNPLEIPNHDAWKKFAADHKLRCVFETGAAMGFKENLSAADCILTTSVAEGFGLVFLEAWLAETKLVGRNLPEITGDFVESGVRFDGMSPRLDVPLDWVGKDAFVAEFSNYYAGALQGFGLQQPSEDEFQDQLRRLFDNNLIDFAILPSGLQRRVIEIVSNDAERLEQLRALNSWVADAVAGDSAALIRANSEVVAKSYSLQVTGHRLNGIYDAVMSSQLDEAVGAFEGQRILDSLLEPSRLHPIRLET